MHPKRSHWLPARWLALLTALLLLVSGIAFSEGGPLSAQTVTTTATTTATATDSATTATPTGMTAAPADTTTPVATDAASPSSTAPAGATTTTTAASGAAPAATTAPAASGAATASGSPDVAYEEVPGGGGPHNVVKVINKNDNRLRVRGKIQLGRIPGPDAEPENDAEAYGSCTNCATFAVALQIDLISRTAGVIIPKNTAVAVNVQCSHCTTVARALQYVIQVDDPTQTPDNVKSLISEMQQELKAAADNDTTVDQAEARINAVIAQFNDLGQSLLSQRDEKTDDVDPGATAPPDATVLTPAPTDTPTSTASAATPAATATTTP